jgi:hypothetical protein
MPLYNNHQLDMMKMMVVHSKNRKQPINVPCGQKEELLNVKASVTYSYHFALTG